MQFDHVNICPMINTNINKDDNRVEFVDNLTEFYGMEVHKNITKIAGIQEGEDDAEDSTIEEKALNNLPQSSQNEI